MNVRVAITFLGRVQGVGFRMTTRSVASGYAVAGFVRNEPDGSVLCIVEGERAEIDRFVRAVEQAMEGCVREKRMVESPATGEFHGFNIRR